jgi:ribosomal protein S18 acetylase RimI-like enzyme
METVEIVNLQPSQWEQYKNLRLKALKEEPQAFGSSYEENVNEPGEKWERRLEKALRGEGQWLVFAKRGDELIGMAGAFAKEEKGIVQVSAMYVVREVRGQGISTKLMEELISQIEKNKSIKKLVLEVNPIQESALKLYESCGFKTTGTEKRILGDSKEYQTYVM